MNPWSCLIRAISLLQRLIACLFSVLQTKAHRGGCSFINYWFLPLCAGEKKAKKSHKIRISTGEATFNILMMAVGSDITSPFCTLKISFSAKIFLSLWLAGHICVSSLFLLQSFHAALKRHGFLHVFILHTEPAHYAIIPVCQLVAIQKRKYKVR